MFEIFKIIITFLLTGVVGALLSQRIQKKSFLHQIKINQTQKEIERIKEIASNIEKDAGMRIFYGRNLIENYINTNTEEIEKARLDYRKSVIKWNENLSSYFLELRSLGLTHLAFDLERNVHENLFKAHRIIDDCIRKNRKVKLGELKTHYSLAFDGLRKISKALIEISNMKWSTIRNGNSEQLTQYNLNKANLFTLIFALFHKNPHSLRIHRSDDD
jgi:hypothetical protein